MRKTIYINVCFFHISVAYFLQGYVIYDIHNVWYVYVYVCIYIYTHTHITLTQHAYTHPYTRTHIHNIWHLCTNMYKHVSMQHICMNGTYYDYDPPQPCFHLHPLNQFWEDTPEWQHLVGKMMLQRCIEGYSIFRHTQMISSSHDVEKAVTNDNGRPFLFGIAMVEMGQYRIHISAVIIGSLPDR